MQLLADSYTLAADAQLICARLLDTCEEFSHVTSARLVCVLSQPTPVLHGAPCAAFIAEPRVQGPFHVFFDWALAAFCAPVLEDEDPEFVVMIDAALWPSMADEQRERLLYHELCHVVAREDEYGVPKLQEDGRPALKLVPHDYEFFDAEVRRYGPITCQLESAAVAIADGHRRAQQRERERAPRAA